MTAEEVVAACARAVAAALDGVPAYARRMSALEGGSGVVVRPGQARVLAQYIDGSREVLLPVRVMCRDRDEGRAMAWAEEAQDALDGLVIESAGGEAVAASADEWVRELELSDSLWHVWEATANVTYLQRGDQK